MENLKKKSIIILAVFLCQSIFLSMALAEQNFPFTGYVTENGINVRADSTVGSEVICSVNKGERIEAVSEKYNWYKIKLPECAPSYIHKDMLGVVENNKAKLIRDKVNIRLKPNLEAEILGRISEGETVEVIKAEGDWYQIKPVNNTFAWIHKKFLEEIPAEQLKKEALAAKEQEKEKAEEAASKEPKILIEGVIKPKFITTIARYKLITDDKEVYLLKGEGKLLSDYKNKRVKVGARSAEPYGNTSILEVERIGPIN